MPFSVVGAACFCCRFRYAAYQIRYSPRIRPMAAVVAKVQGGSSGTTGSSERRIRYMEWEATGFAGVANNTVYLVFDPTDLLSSVASSHSPGKYSGIPCELVLVRRLESHWYSVWFYTGRSVGPTQWTGLRRVCAVIVEISPFHSSNPGFCSMSIELKIRSTFRTSTSESLFDWLRRRAVRSFDRLSALFLYSPRATNSRRGGFLCCIARCSRSSSPA